MKTHTSQFKDKIKEFGRELDSKITYTISGTTTELGTEQLNSVSPHYQGAILKSVMKQLDIDSNVEIPVGTILNYQLGVKVGNSYDYIDYGNYIVKDVEKQEDTRSWKITCYDKMLYAMKDYENSNITFPITIKDYLGAICTKVGLEYIGDQFTNSDKIIQNELYLDENNRSLGYTFRTVLDEIAQVSGGTICINTNDRVEVRYIHDVGELQTITGNNLSISNSKEAKLQNFELKGNTTQASTPTPSSPSELVSVGYENLLELTLKINNTNIRQVNADVTISGDEFIFNAIGGSDMYFGQIIASGSTYQEYAGVLIDVSNCSSISYYVSNPLFIKNFITSYNESKVSLGYSQVSNSQGIYNLPSGTRYITFRFGYGSAVSGTTYKTKVMITKGIQQPSYIPYGKYGIEVKITGKNLFDKTKTPTATYGSTVNILDNGIRVNLTSAGVNRYIGIRLENSDELLGKTINISSVITPSSTNNGAIRLYWTNGNSLTSIIQGALLSTGNITYNIPNSYPNNTNGISIVLSSNYTSNTSQVGDYVNYTNLQIEKGNQATTYEAYKSNTYLYTLDNPLRAIGNIKDLLYIKNNYLYVNRKIGSVDLSTITWSTYGHNIENYHRYSSTTIENIKYVSANTQLGNGMAEKYVLDVGRGITSKIDKIAIDVSQVSVVAIDSPTGEFIYELATPIVEELGQVEMPSTYEGITYIDAPSTINISYITEFETIDEEYLKDVNVNFGEKFGPANTLILSRGGDGDKISSSIPNNLADADKIAIQISDNQIMNGNNRDIYMPQLLNTLYGLEYYINDFLSTGICYLDLCDRYRIKIGNNTYKCVMFNDEVNITQGLEENIYTEMQEENEQQYQYMSSNDRGITQANIIANKASGEIYEITQIINGDDGLAKRINRVETKQTATERTIDVISQNITYEYDQDGNPISSDINAIKTTTGYTFDAEGFKIAKSENEFTTLIDETGMYFKDGNTRIGEYTKDGSRQKNLELFGVYYYGKNDINATPMFVAQLYTDENGNEAFGHFINRGD